MRILGKIVSILGNVILILLGLVFAFIELRILFVGDFALSNNVAASFFQHFFRALTFLIIVVNGLFSFFRNKSEKTIIVSTFLGGSSIILSLTMFLGLEWYFGLAFLVGSLLSLFGSAPSLRPAPKN